jgi:SAM-dependent methyltransferase
MSEIALDLGCGICKQPGAIGVDLRGHPDVVADISGPLPFRDNCAGAAYLNDVIEHIPNTIALMEEIWRVCKPNALVHIRVVNWDSQYMAIDPTHCRPIHPETFSFFGNRPGREYYTHARFDLVRLVKGYDRRMERWTLGSHRLLELLAHYLHNVLIDLNFTLRAVKGD